MAGLPPQRILVVDDEPFVCEAVKTLLNFDGHVVEATGSPKEALAAYDRSKFDIVITDYAMPEMKGDELVAAIKTRNPAQPVVMITAYPELRPTAGVDYLVSKPFRLEDLRKAVAAVLTGAASKSKQPAT